MKTTGSSLVVTGLAIVVMACQSPTSSNSGSTSYSLQCIDIPDQGAYSSYQVVLQSAAVDASGNTTLLDNVTLGNVSTSGQISQTVRVNSRAQFVGVFLVDSTNTPDYFLEWDLSQVTHNTLATSYWVNYEDPTTYAISSQHVQPLAPGVLTSLTYSDRPYYLFSAPSTISHSYQLTLQDVTGNSTVYYTSNLTNLTSGTFSILTANTVGETARMVIQGTATPEYLFVVPSSYSTPTQSNISYGDVTQQLAISFPVNNVVSTDSGQTLYMVDQNDNAPSNNVLRQWNVAAGTAQVVETFSTPIISMVAAGTTLYIGDEQTVYRYDTTNGTLSTLFSTSSSIGSIAQIGNDDLLVTVVNGANSVVGYLVQESTGIVESNSSISVPSQTSVWVPGNSELYLVAAGETMSKLAIDLTNQTVGAFQIAYSLNPVLAGQPLVQLGSDFALLTSNWTIFRLDSTATSTGIAYSTSLSASYQSLSIPIVSAYVSSGSIYTLQTVPTSSSGAPPVTTLIQWQAAPPYSQLSTVATWNNETAVALIQTPSGALVVDQTQLVPGYGSGVVIHQIPSTSLSFNVAGKFALPATRTSGSLKNPYSNGKPLLLFRYKGH